MITYQDLLAVGERETDRAEFVKKVIFEHQNSALYQTAKVAEDYYRCRNTTTMTYQRTLTTVTGQVVPDRFKATHRSTSNFFQIFVTQLAQFVLGNGAEWGNTDTEEKLGNDFDTRLQDAEKKALRGGVSFGFWNLDHVEIFSVLEFAPLLDEENGALASGVRFWQIDNGKPLRATLYELDGYTDFMWISNAKYVPDANVWQKLGDGVYEQQKRPYILRIESSEADGSRIYAGENYEGFPIVPLWGNSNHQSELVGQQEKIDAYDFILNGWENDLDNAQLYWIIKGAGGMDDIDLQQFLDRLRTVGAAAPADGQEVDPVTISLPYDARERLLERLERQLYKDAMLLNPADIVSGATTATQIKAAYEPQNVKANDIIYCLLDFCAGICKLAGIDDVPTFSPSMINNTMEEVQTIVMAAPYLGSEYTTRKILNLLGDKDKAEDVLKAAAAEAEERLGSLGGLDVTDNG